MSTTEQPPPPMISLAMPPGVDALSVAFSPDGRLFICGCNDGQVRTYYAERSFKPITSTLNSAMTEGKDMKAPVISAEFRPEVAGGLSNVLSTVCVDGNVVLWHMGQSKKLASVRLGHDLLTSSFSPSGDALAVAGLGSVVSLLDGSKLAVSATLSAGEAPDGTVLDCGRLQSLKFIDAHTLVTCGWGHTLRVWDRRVAGGCVANIYGPYVSGDGIDVAGPMCAVASYRDELPLELYDLRTQQKLRDVPWPAAKASSSSLPSSRGVQQDAGAADEPVMLFCCKYSPDGTQLAAGGNDGNFEVFDMASADLRSCASPGLAQGKRAMGPHTVNAVRWSNDGRHVAAACMGQCVVMQTRTQDAAK